MTIFSAAITLFLVLDPLGNVPVFLSVLESVAPERRWRVIAREMLIALVVLTAFLFLGRHILTVMGISEPAVSVGGGVVLFVIALRMIFPRNREVDERQDTEPMIVPLAIPMVAGPSAMATLILMVSQAPERVWHWLIALAAAWAVSALLLVSSDWLRNALGQRGLAATERLMGMILITVSIEMLLGGIATFLGESVSQIAG